MYWNAPVLLEVGSISTNDASPYVFSGMVKFAMDGVALITVNEASIIVSL